MTSIPSIYDQLAEQRAKPQGPAPAPPAERTVYDDLLDRQQQQADLLRVASFNAAVKSSPDAAAEAQRISQQLGLPADVAERNLDQVRAISAQRDYENRNLAAFSPILDRQLRDPEFARIAHDDLDRLSTWEGMVRGFGVGRLETEQGLLGERLRSGLATPAEIDRLAAVRTQLQALPRPRGFLAGSAKVIGQQSVTLPKALEVGMAGSLAAGGTALALGQAGPQALVPEEVLTVPAAMAAGFGIGATGALAVQAYQMEAGSAYLDMVESRENGGLGYDKATASAAAVGVGIANAALELVGMKLLAKGAGITGQALREALGTEVRQGVAQALVRPTLGRAALQFAKGYGTGLGGEVATETLQEGVNIVAEELARRFSEDPAALESTVTRGEVIQRLVETATETAQGMALLAVPGPSMHLWSDSRRAAAAERQVRQFQALANGAVESKLRQRSPAGFEQFAKATVEGTGAENLFIDAQAFGQVLRQADLEAGEKGVASAADTLRAALPDVMQQVEEAMRTGGDVVIPTEKFAAHIAGTPLADQLLPHLRSDADAMSMADAEVFRQGEKERSAEAQQILKQQETENRVFVEQAHQVEESLRQQLGQTGKMAASEAVAAAKFYRDIVVTQAQRAGMLPAEFVAKYPLRVLASDQAAAVGDLRQPSPPFSRLSATDTPEGPASPSPDLVQPIIGDLGGIDPQTPGRGSYRPADFTIFLHRTADASTFLHELSHHYLHVLADLASRPNAAPAIAADMQQLLQWFGVADLATWNSLTLEQQRNHHEAFAYSFELYLFEGKSPSQALEGLFARFARWLRRAYTTIRGELNTAYRNETGEDLPALTPEVRAVMDRMVASDEEIAHQASVRGMTPQFATQAEAGMNDAEWLAYQELHQDQRDAASAQLTHDSMRQMQWLSGARAGLLRRMQQKHDALRAKVRDQVATTIEQRPVYRAIAWLRDGPAAAEGSEGATQADGESHRLASDAVRKLLPEGAKLGGVWRAITEKKGLAPDLVARLHGFRTGEDLVAAIAEAPALEVAIDTETDKRMLAEHSELADPQKRELAVQAALHNEARTRFLGAELRHLTKATQPVRLMVQAAKSTAARILAGKPVGQIQPREHVVAEERARRASIQAMRRGDSAAAGEQKRVELLQHHLAKGAVDARQEIDEALEQFERLWESDEKIGKARSIEHVAAARAILAHFGLARGGMKPAEHMAQAFAYAPEVAQELQPMVDRMGAIAGKNTWRSVTLDEFRTMREAVEQLWFQARRANEMVVEGRKVRIAAAAGELAARLEELGLPARAPGDRGTETPGEQFRREGVLAGFASLTRVEHWAAALGPVFTRYVFRPIADGLVNYRRDRNIYVQRYEQLLRAHREAGHLDLEDILAPELNGHIFHGKPELLGALLHTGNRSNLRKLVVGWKWHDWDEGPDLFDTSRWDKFQARMVQKGVLTKADFDFVQAVWDMNEGLKPQLQETHRGLFGHYFEEVEASEIATQWGVYRGGYVPATADSTEQGTALHKQLEELQGDYRNVVPAVQRGFTKSRTDITRRLTLDIRQMAGHLDKVLRFAHVQPAVKDVLGVLKHRDLAGTLHRWNPTVMDNLLLPWLNRAASGLTTEPAKNKVVGRWLTQLRQNADLAIMAFNVVNAAQNLAGILTARTLVAGRDLRASLFEVVGSPRETAARIAGLSPMMANRMEGRIHELTSSIDELARGRGLLGKANQLAARYGYLLQKMTQGFVDQVVWIGAYNQAMREQSAAVGDKEAEATAVARADAVVRRTQGSQEAEDVSAYETGAPWWKAFVQFGSWFNNNANLNASEWVRLKRELGWRGVVGTRAGALALWGFLLPTLAASWIQQVLGAGWDDDDDDGMADEYVGWFFASQGRALLATVPFAGQAGLVAWNFLDEKPYNDRFPTLPVGAIGERGLRAIYALGDGATGTRVRDVLTFASTLVGVPLTVVGRPLGYAMSVDEGRVQPTGPVDFARGLVTGQASAESKR